MPTPSGCAGGSINRAVQVSFVTLPDEYGTYPPINTVVS